MALASSPSTRGLARTMSSTPCARPMTDRIASSPWSPSRPNSYASAMETTRASLDLRLLAVDGAHRNPHLARDVIGRLRLPEVELGEAPVARRQPRQRDVHESALLPIDQLHIGSFDQGRESFEIRLAHRIQ